MHEADNAALERVMPNFRFNGQWYAKARFFVCYTGERPPTILPRQSFTGGIPPDNADPIDWGELMPQYLYWRRRYRKMGYSLLPTGMRSNTTR